MCQCRECLKHYKDLNLPEVGGLLVDNGVILEEEFYQKLEQEQESQDMKLLLDMDHNDRVIREEMSKYDHVTQCEIAYQYNSVKEKIVQYMSTLDQTQPVSTSQLQPLIDELYSMKRKGHHDD